LRKRRFGRERGLVSAGIGNEFGPASGAAEVIRVPRILGVVRSGSWVDLHPAHGIRTDRRVAGL